MPPARVTTYTSQLTGSVVRRHATLPIKTAQGMRMADRMGLETAANNVRLSSGRSFFPFVLGRMSSSNKQGRSSLAMICSASADSIPSWEELGSTLPSPNTRLVQDTVLDPSWPDVPEGRVVFFRDRNGWCTYCERVWLALEAKGVEYDEVLIELMGRKPGWYYDISNGSTPAIKWEDGTYQGESLDILREIDERYPNLGSPLFPLDSADRAEAEKLIAAFRPTMPQGCRPSARTAFMFRGAGTPAPRAEFEKTLDKLEDMLSQRKGPFFMGEEFGAVDCTWAPFLERYSVQLPLMHAGLRLRDNTQRPHLSAWFDAMEERVPAYSSRVQGSPYSWAAVLATAGFGNSYSVREYRPAEETSFKADEKVWRQYVEGRIGLGSTPREEVAMRMWKNREGLVADAVRNCNAKVTPDLADKVIRVCLTAMTQGPCLSSFPSESEAFTTGLLASFTAEELKTTAAIAEFNSGRICVPRDMGHLPGREFVSYFSTLADIATALASA